MLQAGNMNVQFRAVLMKQQKKIEKKISRRYLRGVEEKESVGIIKSVCVCFSTTEANNLNLSIKMTMAFSLHSLVRCCRQKNVKCKMQNVVVVWS
jgi:hypothetical protein